MIIVSLGRWILRYLFANLIDEEIKRDEAYRHKLNEDVEKRQNPGRANAPTSISLPQTDPSAWDTAGQITTPRANGSHLPPTTPGLGIGLATPGLGAPSSLPGVPESVASGTMSPLEKRTSVPSRPSAEVSQDYFTSVIGPADSAAKAAPAPGVATTAESADGTEKKDKDKENGKASGTFGKKFRMSFGTKKLGRSASQATQDKPAVVDEKAEESETSSTHDKEVEDNFLGVIQKIRNEYDKQIADSPDKSVETLVTPSLPGDTPVLKLPGGTKVIIQEETSGGSANLYQGTVDDLGKDADIIEQKAPMWLGDVLLQNSIPFKDPVKVSFVLYPLDDLPAIGATDGNNRLNANRMLRVKKILAYVAERIEAPPEEDEKDALRPDEYLELYCNEQVRQSSLSMLCFLIN